MSTTGCPINHQKTVAERFSPFTFLADPHPFLSRARQDAPIFYHPELDYWVVTRYDTIKTMLADSETYASHNTIAPITPWADDVPQILQAGHFGARPFIVNIGQPEHLEHKRIFGKVLSPRTVRKMKPAIRALAGQMIGAFADKGKVDLVEHFTLEFPALVVFQFLGIPAEDVRDIKGWADDRLLLFFGHIAPEKQRQQAHGLVQFWQYIETHIEKQMEDPGDHFVGDMVRLLLSGEEKLTVNDIANYCWSFLFAGHETTTSQIGNMMRDLLTQRAAWEELCANRALIPQAVEESLRMNTSVFNWRRITTKAVEVHGQHLPAGSNLFLVFGSANRDATRFAHPDTFDLHRSNVKKHLGFGFGTHYCIGSALARLQLVIVLEELTQSLPSLRLVEEETPIYINNVSFRGPRRLWVEWDVDRVAN